MSQIATDNNDSIVETPDFDEDKERKVAWRLAVLVLVTLTAVKPLGGIAVIGTLGFTLAAAMQLYLPLWRCEKLGLPYAAAGLHLGAWRTDLKWAGLLCAFTFPPFVLGHHLYMTEMAAWANALGWPNVAALLPRRVFAPETPATLWGWLTAVAWFLQIVATHALGVALPEETFYRGYLQPRLEHRFAPRFSFLGVAVGRGAVITAALFALGHFLGEWNPLRLGPFFPALIFAWQRNATRSVVGAITYHAACNVIGEIMFRLYQPA